MRRLVAAIAVLAALALPAGAGAATVQLSGGFQLQVNAGAGETNIVQIARSGANYVVTDTGTPPTPGPGCGPFGAAVICPAVDIFSIEVQLDNLNDTASVADSVVGDFELNISLRGEDGQDTLNAGANSQASLFGGPDGDFLNGDSNNETLQGGGGGDLITGGAEADTLDGDLGDDVMTGGPGEDTFITGSTPDGADTMDGGADEDRVSYSERFVPVTIDADGAADDGEACPGPACEDDNVRGTVERISGGMAADQITGGPGTNDLDGHDGNDTLRGLGGPDELEGDDGADRLLGGGGHDYFLGQDGADRSFGGSGDDHFDGGFRVDGGDLYDGGKGLDLVIFDSPLGRRVDMDGRADDGVGCPGPDCEGDNVRADVEDLIGGDGRDIFIGSKAGNDFSGGLGSDRLVGGAGPDGLLGEDGADRLIGGSGRDFLEGGVGPDRITSRDKSPDEVSCGGSIDTVVADRRDRTGVDCDRVRRGRR